MIELHYFVAVDGKCPFEIWFEGLDGATAAKVTVALARVGQGNVSNCRASVNQFLNVRLIGARATVSISGATATGW